jgi:hypothetical protein
VTRLLALVGAVAMIVVAVVVRGAIADDTDSGASGGGSDGVVVCALELRDVCPDGAIVEEVAMTADRFATSGAEAPAAWLTFDPWPAMVDVVRAQSGLEPMFDADLAPLAASALVIVGPEELGECDWRCVVESGLRFGTRPLDGGLGLLHLSVLLGGIFGSPSYATNDIDAFARSRIAQLVDEVEASTGPVRQLLQSRAFFDVAFTHEVEAKAALAEADPSRSAGLALIYPLPVAFAVVVGTGDVTLLDEAADALLEAGWREPESSGLPSAGVMTALRGLL